MYKQQFMHGHLDDKDLNTRNYAGPIFNVTKPNYEFYKKSIKYKGAIEWNSLDPNIRNIASLSAFKYTQKVWLMTTIPQV